MIPKLLRFQLYLLQLENYHLGRYLRLAARRMFSPLAPRRALVWTPKLRAVFVGGLLLQAVAAVLIVWALPPAGAVLGIFLALVIFLFLLILHFAFLALAVPLLWPIDWILKERILGRARARLAARPDLIVVGVTGSYGKTSMKEAIAAALAERFVVLRTPENINTPVGVARLILRSLTPGTEALIVEMGAYRRGDIKKLCQLTPPDVAVLTGINESHLERFGTLEATAAAKFEIADHAKPGAAVVLNADSELVRTHYARHCGNRKPIFYTAAVHPLAAYAVAKKKIRDDGLGLSFSLTVNGEEKYALSVPLLGEYAVGTVMGAVCAAESLGVTPREIVRGLRRLQPIPRRLQPLLGRENILVIDDSYNGSPDGVRETIAVLSRFKGRRKLYLTAGLVEMGRRTAEVHRAIGRQLSEVADMVLLVNTRATSLIAEGLHECGYAPEKIRWFESAEEARLALPSILRSGDVIIFQVYDLPENYL
jgi:UDP-N-acetylmuramoyl-tripeptide--D-alanyl-D-alanine ligase